MEEPYKKLEMLGFSQYEIEVYREVINKFPITIYEIYERSGVPSSLIYEVVAKLLQKEAVCPATLVPLTYVPFPVEDLINRLRSNCK